MSTAFHPQTDGQTERLNQTIEVYLHAFVNHEQNNWVSLLLMMEFAYNNSITTATDVSPLYANYGFHPPAMDPAIEEPRNHASKVYAHWMHSIHEQAKHGLEKVQETMKRYSDLQRQEAPVYQIGDLLMLNGRNI